MSDINIIKGICLVVIHEGRFSQWNNNHNDKNKKIIDANVFTVQSNF